MSCCDMPDECQCLAAIATKLVIEEVRRREMSAASTLRVLMTGEKTLARI